MNRYLTQPNLRTKFDIKLYFFFKFKTRNPSDELYVNRTGDDGLLENSQLGSVGHPVFTVDL